jgi:hypothetical protein
MLQKYADLTRIAESIIDSVIQVDACRQTTRSVPSPSGRELG